MQRTVTSTFPRVAFLLVIGLLLSGLVSGQQAHAQWFSILSGDTSGGDTFNRPDCVQTTPQTLSCEASDPPNATRFEESLLVINETADYTISSTQSFDGIIILYGPSGFDEDLPLDDLFTFNDDDTDNRTSKIEATLPTQSGNNPTFYTLVTTGFVPNDAGTYTNRVDASTRPFLLTDGTDLWPLPVTTTAGAQEWVGPDCPDAANDPLATGSCTGSTVLRSFVVQELVPDCSAAYLFVSDQVFNGVVMLYEGAFDPDNPAQNLIAINDDWPAADPGTQFSAFMPVLQAGTQYFLVTTGFDTGEVGDFGTTVFSEENCSLTASNVATATEDAGESPQRFTLSPVYPNPFNPQARFTLSLDHAQHVTIDVYDVLGRRVTTLHDGLLAPSTEHAFTFEAAGLPSGLYTIRAQGERFTRARTAFLAK